MMALKSSSQPNPQHPHLWQLEGEAPTLLVQRQTQQVERVQQAQQAQQAQWAQRAQRLLLLRTEP